MKFIFEKYEIKKNSIDEQQNKKHFNKNAIEN